MFVGAPGYAVYRRPVLTRPLTVALAGAALLIATVTTLAGVKSAAVTPVTSPRAPGRGRAVVRATAPITSG